MTKEEVLENHFYFYIKNIWSPQELVEFAEQGSGYAGDDGAYGVWYIGDSKSPQLLEIGYWDGEEASISVTLEEYLNALKTYLLFKGEVTLKERVDKIII